MVTPILIRERQSSEVGLRKAPSSLESGDSGARMVIHAASAPVGGFASFPGVPPVGDAADWGLAGFPFQSLTERLHSTVTPKRKMVCMRVLWRQQRSIRFSYTEKCCVFCIW